MSNRQYKKAGGPGATIGVIVVQHATRALDVDTVAYPITVTSVRFLDSTKGAADIVWEYDEENPESSTFNNTGEVIAWLNGYIKSQYPTLEGEFGQSRRKYNGDEVVESSLYIAYSNPEDYTNDDGIVWVDSDGREHDGEFDSEYA